MPYLLTSNPPGSPTSWVKMETDSVLSGHSEVSSSNVPNGNRQQQQQHYQQQTRPRALALSGLGSKYSDYANSVSASATPHASSLVPNGGMSSYGSQGHMLLLRGNGQLLQQQQTNGGGGDRGVSPPPPPMMVSPTTVGAGFSNYSLHRNVNHINFNADPRTDSVLSNSPGSYHQIESPYYPASSVNHGTLRSIANQRQQQLLQQQYQQQQLLQLQQLQQQQYPQQERIEVQLLPQDHPDWGDNTTALTGLSGGGGGGIDLAFASDPTSPRWIGPGPLDDRDSSSLLDEDGWQFALHRHAGPWTAAVVSLAAFLSPPLMLALPQMGLLPFREAQLRCDVDCDGLLISFSAKLLLLLLGSWAVFFRQPRSTMPRLFLYRSLIVLLLIVLTFTFWLFFSVRLTSGEQRRRVQYFDVVQYANSMVDALLFVHYLAVLLIEIRHTSPEYYIKIVRSPDGESRSYAIGQLSIQRAAVWVLQKYYTDFPIFNPYLERLPTAATTGAPGAAPGTVRGRAGSRQMPANFKYYDVDGMVNPLEKTRLTSPLIRNMSGKRRDSSHMGNGGGVSGGDDDRFYEENEYDRRLRKRRARLVAAAEEAFAHVKRLNDQRSKTPSSPLEPYQAAQAIFPSLARPLQKYLRITRQQPRHTMESILQQLATCLKYDMAPKAFLEKYLVASPVMQNDREKVRSVQTWSLVCDMLLSRSIKTGTLFQLRQGDLSLLCEVHALPHFNITEEIIDAASNKFLLRNNSETPV